MRSQELLETHFPPFLPKGPTRGLRIESGHGADQTIDFPAFQRAPASHFNTFDTARA